MWTEKEINLLDSIPDYFSEIYEYQQLFNALNYEIQLFQEYLKQDKDDIFFVSSSETIVSRYQNLLKTSGSTTEQKKSNIISKFSETVPFSLDTLKSIISRHAATEVEIDMSQNGKILAYYQGSDYLVDKTSLFTDVYNVIPANLQFNLEYLYTLYQYLIDKTYGDLSTKTWNTILLGR